MSLTYKDAGVNIEAGNELVRRIIPLANKTFSPKGNVLTEIGGFAGFFSPILKSYQEPVLVSGCDGVGTKVKIAQLLNRHNTIGIDLVAMCVNDLIVTGADPLFFLDYLAVGRLNVPQGEKIISGIVEGCKQARCALLGGETAEMPSIYKEDEYDLAGFAVGIVDKKRIIDGSRIIPGDKIIGIASSGLHSNGYSLVRKILENELDKWAEDLLIPTRIYVEIVSQIKEQFDIKGIAHITGGGLLENIPRVLPKGTKAVIKEGTWMVPDTFKLLAEKGEIPQEDMYRTFNMGIGLVVILSGEEAHNIENRFEEKIFLIGEIKQGETPDSRGQVDIE